MSKVLITSALPYANGPLHFGHIAGAYLPGDCYARFQRLIGAEVLYLCGSDEYGVPITIQAELSGRTPKEHVDLFHQINQGLFKQLAFSFDHYSRTTWLGHVATVQQYFKDLLENGYIEEKVTDQLYSEKEKRFLADRYVVGICPKCGFDKARGDECQKCGANYEAMDLKEPRSKVSGSPLVLKPTKHWFLCFDRFKEKLNEWISQKPWKGNVLNFAKAYIDDLRPRAITRDSEWGVPIPLAGTEGKVFYVWFDAPIGYISAAKEWAALRGEPDAWRSFWCDPSTKLVHFIGKDNIPFHAVFFPAMTMGQNVPYKLVDELPANEFLNLEGKQFSKSDGWTIDLDRFFAQFSADQIRYYLAANAPETQDAEFSWREFQLCSNAQLLGKYGNFAHRTLVFAQKYAQGKIPPIGSLGQEEHLFLAEIGRLAKAIEEAYSQFHLRKAAQGIMELATCGNVYFDAKKPWQLASNPAQLSQMETAIHCCIICLKTLALVSSPIIPNAAQGLWELIGFDTQLAKQNWNAILEKDMQTDQPLPPPIPLFKKIEDEAIEKEQLQLKGNISTEAECKPLKEEIPFDLFAQIDLRVGQIVEVEIVPKSKKLLKLLVDLGFEKRTVVSGIAPHFTDPKGLIGKKVTIVANLKPAKLMGIESHGMLLAADIKGGLEILELRSDEAVAGDSIH